MKYKSYSINTLQKIPQLVLLDEQTIEEMQVVANVLPFKVNNYVLNELINWDNIPNDPIFRLVFPHRDMLKFNDYSTMKSSLQNDSKEEIKEQANTIRKKLNPHPAGQKKNIPLFQGNQLRGIQHKYRETVLFFPRHGQNCHAFCSFCFRWTQFSKMKDTEKTIDQSIARFASDDVQQLIDYVQKQSLVTDILITGGDPLTMSAKNLNNYLRPILESRIPHLKNIRLGSKTLSYWPYRYTQGDNEEVLALLSEINDSSLKISFMAHFNHPQEMSTDVVKEAISNIQATGTIIRTQSPILRHINNNAEIWSNMWQQQVNLGMTPYYMFVVRDTGAQHYFGVPLIRAWQIFRDAYSQVSGLCRTARGPSMSCDPGKIEIVGPSIISNVKVLVLRFIQARNPDLVNIPFYAELNAKAIWIDELYPAFSHQFPFETANNMTNGVDHLLDNIVNNMVETLDEEESI